jgi:hypothetical protein
MAYYFITASKDASVYLQQPNQNTGLDGILEVTKVYYGTIKDVSRALLKFDVSHLSSSISNGNMNLGEATLVLRETESEEVPLEYTIYAHPISGSWQMGKGTRFDDITTEGVTWNYREGDSKDRWLPNNVYALGSTGSYNGLGGVYYTNFEASQYFNYQTADIQMDVKSMVRAWLSGSIPNDGIILKHANDVEEDTEDYGIIKLFSKETYTIHQPKLRIGWNDQSFLTGSLSAITSTNLKVVARNFKKEYKVNTTPKIEVLGRELYPLKTFTNTFAYNDIKYLPTSSYYQIKDFASDDVIVPFGDYSKISCNGNGNYFKLNLSNWEVGRVYKMEFKVDFGDGDIQYFDDDLTFEVIN